MPDFIPGPSVAPLLGVTASTMVAAVCLMVFALFRDFRLLTGLAALYAAMAVHLLGLTALGLNSPPAAAWGSRILLLGLAWLPPACLLTLAGLTEFRPGRSMWIVIGVSAIFSALLLAFDQPAAGTVTPPGPQGVVSPRPGVLLAAVVVYASIGATALNGVVGWLIGRRRLSGSHLAPAAIGLMGWWAGLVHDAAGYLGFGFLLGAPTAWLASFWLALWLTLSLAVQFKAMEKTLFHRTAALVEARNRAVLGASAAKVAQHVGAFLNKLVFSLSLIKNENLNSNSTETLAALERGAEKLADFIRTLSSMDAVPQLNFESGLVGVELERVIDDFRPVLEDREIMVQLSGDSRRRIVVDWNLIGQVFDNLLANAVAAVDRRGRIKIAVSESESGWVRIDFRDDGKGMDLETQKRVMEPALIGGRRDTGLGLLLVRNIVEAHGGLVNLDSTPGLGTVVSIHLPANPALKAQES